MKILVISDDLTGASECGGELVRYGLDVSVALKLTENDLQEKEAIIINTDSRSLSEEEAYHKVKIACERLKSESFDITYKKIDSTMRGSIGQEINAMYDVYQPDFVFIAPAYPKNGRQVIDGSLYLNQIPLHETEVAHDPKTPVHDSSIMNLIQQQTKRKVGHLSYKDLRQGYEYIFKRLESFKKKGISYITVDSVIDSDLEILVRTIARTPFVVIWSGSSRLIHYIPKVYGLTQKNVTASISNNKKPILFVVGSVSKIGRVQLEKLLTETNVVGIEVQSTKILEDDNTKENELKRVIEEAKMGFQQGKNVALFSSSKVKETQKIGIALGKTVIEISNYISEVLGELAAYLINHYRISHLFLTGGDTAQQVLHQLDVSEFHLIDEVEPGIPVGELNKGSESEIFVITKAGSFGTERAMIKAYHKLQGNEYYESSLKESLSEVN